MINKYIKNFKSIIYFLFFVTISISIYSAQKIDISDVQDTMNFVGGDGKIFKKYQGEFINKAGVNGNIEKWSTFKNALDSDQKKGIAGEVAAKFFFEKKGYKILEDHYIERVSILNSESEDENDIFSDKECTTKKGPDNGIDGLFILKNESIQHHSKIIINEAKFRSNQVNLLENDFGFVTGKIQQSHSNWNKPRFSSVKCLSDLDYDQENIVRTATLLGRDGTLNLYYITDK